MSVGSLSAELEQATLQAIAATWDDLNATWFRRSLKRPVFLLGDAPGMLGRWSGASRTLELSRHLLLGRGWGVLVEVLKHEMAHQYVDERLGIRDEPAHGPAFREVCDQRGFDARATGVGPRCEADDEQARLLERIAKLLALAESSNEHEAQSAAAAAQRLMLKHNLEAIARGQARNYGFAHLGEPTGRVSEAERVLATILGDHFFVDPIWVPVWRPLEGRRGSVLEICGSEQNLELAAYAYEFLRRTGERLWREHRRERRLRSDAGRREYLTGVMVGFRSKLAGEQERQRAEGLVWVGDPALGDYLRSRHPYVRHTRIGGRPRGEAYAQGKAAGQGIVLHRGVHGPAGTGIRLLRGS